METRNVCAIGEVRGLELLVLGTTRSIFVLNGAPPALPRCWVNARQKRSTSILAKWSPTKLVVDGEFITILQKSLWLEFLLSCRTSLAIRIFPSIAAPSETCPIVERKGPRKNFHKPEVFHKRKNVLHSLSDSFSAIYTYIEIDRFSRGTQHSFHKSEVFHYVRVHFMLVLLYSTICRPNL